MFLLLAGSHGRAFPQALASFADCGKFAAYTVQQVWRMQVGDLVQGQVLGRDINGGINIRFDDGRFGFLPGGGGDLREIERSRQPMTFRVIELNTDEHDVVVGLPDARVESRQPALLRPPSAQGVGRAETSLPTPAAPAIPQTSERKLWFVPGQCYTGVIGETNPAGCYVRVNGRDGFVLTGDLAWCGAEAAAVQERQGESYQMVFLGVTERQFRFSIRAAMTDPWEQATRRLRVGMSVPGVITVKREMYALIDLDDIGLSGVLTASSVGLDLRSGCRILHRLPLGARLQVKVAAIDRREKRILLAYANSEAEAAEAFGGGPDWVRMLVRIERKNPGSTSIAGRVDDLGVLDYFAPDEVEDQARRMLDKAGSRYDSFRVDGATTMLEVLDASTVIARYAIERFGKRIRFHRVKNERTG